MARGGPFSHYPHRKPLVVVVAVVALLASACGARVDPYVGDGVAAGSRSGNAGTGGIDGGTDGGTGTDGGITPGAAGTDGGATGGGGAQGGGGTGGGGAVGGGAASAAELTPQNFPFDPRAQAALCQGKEGNTASDVGVTPEAITFGNVSGLTGILTNTFEFGPQAVQAAFSAVNAAGGICGRQLRLITQDDGQDATKNSSSIVDLIPRVFAFVGSTSNADNGGVPQMASAGVPDVGFAINPNRGASKVFWSPGGTSQYIKDGKPHIYNTLPNGLKAAGNFPKKMAVLSYSIPISADAGRNFMSLFVKNGSSNCHLNVGINPASASMDQDVVTMKQRGCDGVFTTMDITGNAKLLKSMERQGFKPVFKGVTFAGYAKAQIDLAGESTAQGLEVQLPFLPFNDPHPVTQLYQSQVRTYQPGKGVSGFGMQAWNATQMLIYGLLKAGRNPTRASLTKAFEEIEMWNTGGSSSPIRPRDRIVSGPCSMETEVKGQDFVRKWPANGFFCEGELTAV